MRCSSKIYIFRLILTFLFLFWQCILFLNQFPYGPVVVALILQHFHLTVFLKLRNCLLLGLFVSNRAFAYQQLSPREHLASNASVTLLSN